MVSTFPLILLLLLFYPLCYINICLFFLLIFFRDCVILFLEVIIMTFVSFFDSLRSAFEWAVNSPFVFTLLVFVLSIYPFSIFISSFVRFIHYKFIVPRRRGDSDECS